MWCWKRMERIIWTDLVRNGEELQKAREGEMFYKKRKLTLFVKSCVGTAFQKALLKGR